jgi:hypothetical protein
MGIMSNKVTRRVALGSLAGGLAAAPLVIHALKSKYHVDMPDGASASTVGGKIVTNYDGKEITLDIPRMELKTPEDEEKFKAIVFEQLKKNPTVAEVNKLRFEDWKERNNKLRMAELDELEKQQLKEIANSSVGEEEKHALAKRVKEGIQARRTQSAEFLAQLKTPVL